MKVSREGIVLIKSFVGFRSKAVRSEDGGWVIGYGHTASAREGLTVAEPDAELLLQYDLLPVVKGLTRGISRSVNQHQFDALASFALSIGVDRFLGSDVLQSLNDGLPTQAADALIGWPAPVPEDSATRRRIAERALFNADPDQPVHLADLLLAPLTSPTAEPETPAAAVAARAAAVATLLGEPAETSEPPASAESPPAALEPTPELTPEPAPEPASNASVPASEPEVPEPAPTTVPHTPPTAAIATTAPATTPYPAAMHLQRYSPYAAGIVGPLPGVTTVPATPATPPAPPAPIDQPAPDGPTASVAMSIRMAVTVDPASMAIETPVVAEPAEEPAAAEAEPSPFLTTETMEPAPATDNTVATPFAAAAAAPVAAPALVLTSSSTDSAPAEDRPAWPDTQREEPPLNQEPLFGEEPSLSVLRHEIESDTPARFEKSQTGAFLIMGGVGLLASAFSAAAFRLALEEPSPMGETTVVAWTLAVIGGVCVAVSSLNLYMRWGRTQQDETGAS